MLIMVGGRSMRDSPNEMKKWIILVLVGVVAFWGLNNLELIFKILEV